MSALLRILPWILLPAALLALRVGFRLRIDPDSCKVHIQIGGFSVACIPVYPATPPSVEKPKGTKVRKEKAKKQPKKDKPSKQPADAQAILKAVGGLEGAYTLVRTSLETISERLIKRIVFNRLLFDVRVADKDMMKTTQLFGTLSAVLYPMMAWITHTFTVRHYRLNLTPDYAATEFEVVADVQAWLRIIHVPRTILALRPLIMLVLSALRQKESFSDSRPNESILN